MTPGQYCALHADWLPTIHLVAGRSSC